MSINELFTKYNKAIFKQKDFLNLFDGFEMLKHYGVFPVDPKNEMYMVTAKSSAAFQVNSNQKYRHIIHRLGNQMNIMPSEMEEKIIDNIFDTYIRMGLIKHSEAEINFYKNDIMLSSRFVDNDSYDLKTKTSGRSYYNKPMKIFKYFYINDNEFTLVNSIVQEIQKHNYTVAYHQKGDKFIVFISDPYKNIKTIIKNQFDTLDEVNEFIKNYFEKIIFEVCWKKDLQNFFTNPSYDFTMFEQSHLDLYFAYLI